MPHNGLHERLNPVLTLAWLGTSIIGPAIFARRALRRGYDALECGELATARRHLDRAARYLPLRERAVCLLAETDLREGRPSDALFSLNTLLLEQDQLNRDAPRSARVRLLRGLAGCMLGRAAAARRELAAISKTEASIDEMLAACQACLLCHDLAGAQQLLEKLDAAAAYQPIAGELGARIRLCRAALYFRLGAFEKSLTHLPDPADCSPPDSRATKRIRGLLERKLAPVACA